MKYRSMSFIVYPVHLLAAIWLMNGALTKDLQCYPLSCVTVGRFAIDQIVKSQLI